VLNIAVYRLTVLTASAVSHGAQFIWICAYFWAVNLLKCSRGCCIVTLLSYARISTSTEMGTLRFLDLSLSAPVSEVTKLVCPSCCSCYLWRSCLYKSTTSRNTAVYRYHGISVTVYCRRVFPNTAHPIYSYHHHHHHHHHHHCQRQCPPVQRSSM